MTVAMDGLLDNAESELLSLERRKPLQGLSLGRQLGYGAFATVYEGTLDASGIKVAVKVLHAELQPRCSNDCEGTGAPDQGAPHAADSEEVTTAGKLFLREGFLMEKLSHRSLIKCYGLHQIPPGVAGLPVEKREGRPVPRWCMALQVCRGGSLRSLLTEQMRVRNALYTTHDMLCWLLDMAEAVSYLHSQNPAVIHRDLKADNILLEERHVKGCRSHALITDLGLHVRVSAKHNRMLRRVSLGNHGSFTNSKPTSAGHQPSRFNPTTTMASLDVGGAASSTSFLGFTNNSGRDLMLNPTQSFSGGDLLSSKVFMSTHDAHAQGLALPRKLDTLDKPPEVFYDALRSGDVVQSRSTPNAGPASASSRRNSASNCQAGAVLMSLALKAGSKSQASLPGYKDVDDVDSLGPPLEGRSSAHVFGRGSEATSPTLEPVGRRTHSGTSMSVRSSRGMKGAPSSTAQIAGAGTSRLSQVAVHEAAHGVDHQECRRLSSKKSGPPSQTDVHHSPGNNRKQVPASPAMVALVPDSSRNSFTIKAVRPTFPGAFVPSITGEVASAEAACGSAVLQSSCNVSRPQSEWAAPTMHTEGGHQTPLGELAVKGLAGQVMQQLTPEELAWVWSLTGATGSCMYMAPEVHRGEPYNEKVDVFSFGVVAYELLSRSLLVFSHLGTSNLPGINTPEEYVELVADGYRPSLHPPKNSVEQQLWQLTQRCWSQDPNARPSMQDVALLLDVMFQEAELQEEANHGGDAGAKSTCADRCSIM